MFISDALEHRFVNCFPAGDELWEVTYGPIVLGLIDRNRVGKGLIRPQRKNGDYDLERGFPYF